MYAAFPPEKWEELKKRSIKPSAIAKIPRRFTSATSKFKADILDLYSTNN
jgi:hypothetical protein